MTQSSETNSHPPSTSRGRPSITAKKREKMRARIATVADHLFRTEGYSQVSMRRIAREIECSPMTLYKYFDAKIDILRTLWDGVFDELFRRLDSLDLEELDGPEKLRALSLAYVTFWLDNPEHYRLVFMAEGVTQPDVSLFVDNPDMLVRYRIFAQALVDANPGSINTKTVKVHLDVLMCFFHGIAHNRITISGYAWSTLEDMIDIALICPSKSIN